MDPVILAIVIGILVIGNAISIVFLNKKRKTLDLTKPDEAKRANALKFIIYFLPFETLAVSIFLYVSLIGNSA